MSAIVFYIFSAVAMIFSLLVILLRNPITSALSLVVSFFGVSAMFVLLHAPFLGVIQILIYTGAILVLFLYVTMLLNVQGGKLTDTRSRASRVAPWVALPLLLAFLFHVVDFPEGEPASVSESFGSIATVGELLLSPYMLIFEFVSLVLLAAIIGAVILSAKPKKGST